MSQTVLGFDFGTQKIGVAVGQTQTATGQGIATLRYNQCKVPWKKIDELIHTWQPDILVVGIAEPADGKETGFLKKTRAFAHQLTTRYGLPIRTVDERLTTQQADALIQDSTPIGKSITPRRKSLRDQLAAELILKTYLNDFRSR
ncbi:MAG TPA: Holliday junction resolvase RuvX [Gammaproteobacteria bacterium]|nr:Holliday junction resolvase RuvX [Gammaproteobacteria bacterium]HIL19671.1 Holliday junction resolvase RuvX [Gammaproteobacteria bacterium]